jgi:hypothetical protein
LTLVVLAVELDEEAELGPRQVDPRNEHAVLIVDSTSACSSAVKGRRMRFSPSPFRADRCDLADSCRDHDRNRSRVICGGSHARG